MNHAFRRSLQRKIAFWSMLLLGGCGGGSASDSLSGSPPLTVPEPQPMLLASDPTPITEGSTRGDPYFTEGGSGNGQVIDGVSCSNSESYHVHALISIYYEGKRLALPKSIGLNGCTYELHTHDLSGVVHVESAVQKTYTVGQFFEVWGQPLSTNGIAGLNGRTSFYLIENGQITPYTSDPATIQLTWHREIAIVVGSPPAVLDRNSWAGSGL